MKTNKFMTITAVVCAVAVCCMAAPAFASGNSAFTEGGLGGYSTYDEWKAAQDASKSSFGVGVAATFEPGGWKTAVSTTYIALEARFRTWLESAGRAIRSDALKGFKFIIK